MTRQQRKNFRGSARRCGKQPAIVVNPLDENDQMIVAALKLFGSPTICVPYPCGGKS